MDKVPANKWPKSACVDALVCSSAGLPQVTVSLTLLDIAPGPGATASPSAVGLGPGDVVLPLDAQLEQVEPGQNPLAQDFRHYSTVPCPPWFTIAWLSKWPKTRPKSCASKDWRLPKFQHPDCSDIPCETL